MLETRDIGGTRPATDARRLAFRGGAVRRSVLFGLTGLTTVAATLAMAEILDADGLGPLDFAILTLFLANIVWIALSLWTALAGFVIVALRRNPIDLRRLGRATEAAAAPLRTRTAVVMPARHEDPVRVAAAFEAMVCDLAATGEAPAFDFWLLSGSTDPEAIAAERRQWAALRERLGADGRVHYWKREATAGRKAGTVADFIRGWGGRYETMVVLDADSVMSGQTLVELARLMEANPDVGLIQTLPQPIRQTTRFGRILQFAGHLYAPVFATGAAFWMLGEGNYYGHNAIVRIAAFARHAALPVLPGAPPLGGEILSHDFVEAALLRRGGWKVVFLPQLGGSYEELPSNLLDYAARDRRWCQGNLQHLSILGWPGLHPISRLHLLAGAAAFLASPIWLAFLLLSTASMVEEAIGVHDYFPGGYRLFPDWPVSRLTESVSLFAVTLAFLFLPKFLALGLALVRRRQRRAFGGGVRLCAGAAVEIGFSVLLAPIMMALHSTFVAAIALGRGVGWSAQNRSDRGLPVEEAAARLGLCFVVALAWTTLMLAAAPDRLWWILPVVVGLAVSVPVAVISSRSRAGVAGRTGLLLSPAETAPEPVLRGLAHILGRSRAPAGWLPAEAPPLPLPPAAPMAMPAATVAAA